MTKKLFSFRLNKNKINKVEVKIDEKDNAKSFSREDEKNHRCDVRIPLPLYKKLSSIAVSYFDAKIHHRSHKPELTPTILALLRLGIETIESESLTPDQVEAELQRIEVKEHQNHYINLIDKINTRFLDNIHKKEKQ